MKEPTQQYSDTIQCFNRWDRGCHIQKKDGVRCKDCELRAYKPVTLPLVKAHMNGTDPNGNDVVAIYPMLENNLCRRVLRTLCRK